MTSAFRRFNRGHLYVFLVCYALFASLTLFVLAQQSPSDWRENWNVATTLGAVTGPFTGAIARQVQSCCVQFSFLLLPYCSACLFIGFAFQLVPFPVGRIERPARIVTWALGLLGWFGGGVLSLGHALS